MFHLRLWAGEEGKLRIEENLVNLGFAAASNRGASMTTGEYILFLNPDNIVEERTIEEMLRVMDSRPEAGMAGCLVLNPDGTEQRGCRRREPKLMNAARDLLRLDQESGSRYDMRGTTLPESPVEVEAISGAFMFVRRSAMEKVGGLDERYFLHCEDLDWCRRFRDEGYHVLFVPNVVSTHRQGTCSIGVPVRVSFFKHRGMVRYYRKFGLGGTWNPMWLMVAVLVWSHFVVQWMLGTLKKGNAPASAQATGGLEVPPTGKETAGFKNRTLIVLAGGGSMLARYLVPELLARGFEVVALSRSRAQHVRAVGLRWFSTVETMLGGEVINRRPFVLINLAPIWVLPELIEALAPQGLRRIIAFGSTSRFSKSDSTDRKDQELVQTLVEAEQSSTSAATKVDIPVTLFRPTMIYNGGGDANVSAIARFVYRYRVFPLLGNGRGMRQPVHAQDLARICVDAIERPGSEGKTYNLGGGERLAYREMVCRIFEAVGRRPLLVAVPRWLLIAAVTVARLAPRYRSVSISMIDRMNQDMVFDHTDAERDLGWAPRKFLFALAR